MDTAERPTPDFPPSLADDRLAEPPNPEGEVVPAPGPRVTIHGYIGVVVPDQYIHLHHALDYRAYYRIPTRGIASCRRVDSPRHPKLYELEVFQDTPIRYLHATTIEMKASGLRESLDYLNNGKRKSKPDAAEVVNEAPTVPCSACGGLNGRCCLDKQCICLPVQYLLDEEFAILFGFSISSPEC